MDEMGLEEVLMTLIKSKDANTGSYVKGPIRCHKCQLKCRDAAHYLSHKCYSKPASDCAAFPPLEWRLLSNVE
jgi:hypothetical protein